MTYDNLNYDVLTMLQSKLQALDAYKSYLKDAEAAQDEACLKLLEEIQQEDQRHAEKLWIELARLVRLRGIDEDIDEAATTPMPLKTPGGL
jgi:hypothetical protein